MMFGQGDKVKIDVAENHPYHNKIGTIRRIYNIGELERVDVVWQQYPELSSDVPLDAVRLV